MIDFIQIYKSLDFLSDSIRMQYSNFIFRHAKDLDEKKLDEIIRRAKLHEPIEYILNIAEFSGLSFYVDNRCLIPRPETQEIVSKAVEFIQSAKDSKYIIIDVGTGSGCIILSIANYLTKFLKFESLPFLNSFSQEEKLNFIGIDVSIDALEVAKINRKRLELEDKVELIQTDFRDFDFSKYENLIVCSNLPYIPNNEVLQKSVINYEPHLALFGGQKGDELNNLLLENLKPLKNIRAIFMEGHNGAITQYIS